MGNTHDTFNPAEMTESRDTPLTYRDGILEGLKMAQTRMNDYYTKYASMFSRDDTGGAMLAMVEELIKQYSQEEK